MCCAILYLVRHIFASADVWIAVGTWATVVVLALSLYFAFKQVNEAAALRREQTRPYVVLSIDVEQQTLFMLVVENVGSTPAFDVKLDFDRPLQSNLGELHQVRMFNEPIPMIPPGRRFRVAWESSLEVFKDDYPHPLTYTATAIYADHHGRGYGPEQYILDFRAYEGQAVGPKGLGELVKALESLVKEHKKWTDGTKGLRVQAIDAARQRIRDHRPSHIRQAKQAFQQEGLKGPVSFWFGLVRRRYGLWSR